VALHLVKRIQNKESLEIPPATTALGALIHHILKADPDKYQPMNINFGLFTPLEKHFAKIEKKAAIVKRAASDFRKWIYDSVE
jgi:methylenetetrahydrofolate--tRNA-(uracil-5-)-methyltransferase